MKKVLLTGILSVLMISLTFLPSEINKFNSEAVAAEVRPIFNQEIECLTKNIYYEAATESFEGKLAVAQVTLNRVRSGRFASSICGVVQQKINGTCQFSWYCEPATPIRDRYRWEESKIVARMALTTPVAHDLLKKSNAMYYHADYVKPHWPKQKITQIGHHIFYRS